MKTLPIVNHKYDMNRHTYERKSCNYETKGHDLKTDLIIKTFIDKFWFVLPNFYLLSHNCDFKSRNFDNVYILSYNFDFLFDNSDFYLMISAFSSVFYYLNIQFIHFFFINWRKWEIRSRRNKKKHEQNKRYTQRK